MTKKRLFILWFLLALLALPVFNREENGDVLVFSHKKHVIDNSQECTACHLRADVSQLASDKLVPPAPSCLACHDSSAVQHTRPAVTPPPSIAPVVSFSHKAHSQGKNRIDCLACHKGVDKSENSAAEHRPPMADCMLCHQESSNQNSCALCHAPGADLRPVDHRSDWMAQHGPVSRVSRADCALCHEEQACLRCHAMKEPLQKSAHPLNFENTHAIAARGGRENCLTCHDEQRECVTCHRERMVMPRSHASAGWSNRENGGAHARAGRADMESCMSCHNQPSRQPTCAVCHGDGTTGATKAAGDDKDGDD